MYKNRVIGICKIREIFFGALVTLLVYDYSFDHTSKIFYIILIVIIYFGIVDFFKHQKSQKWNNLRAIFKETSWAELGLSPG